MTTNLAYFRKEVSYKINFNVDQTDEDFRGTSVNPYDQIDRAINEAYRLETNKAVSEAGYEWCKKVTTLVWPASQVQLVLPNTLKRRALIRIEDITNSNSGYALWVQNKDNNTTPTLSWYDDVTLQWLESGPAQDVTMQITYIAEPEDMLNPIDEPTLIPERHRDLITYSAWYLLALVADNQVSKQIAEMLTERRFLFWQDLALGTVREPSTPTLREFNTPN
jgi:hypothetical protein